MSRLTRRLWAWLGSIHAAVILLTIWAGLSVVGSLVPQGLAAEKYLASYGQGLGGLLLALGFDRAFSSVLYLAAAIAVALAIVACFLRRAQALRARLGTLPAAGSLALHFGIIVVLAGFMVTGALAREEYLWLSPGSSGTALGVAVDLRDFEIQYYADLSPQQYISRGTVHATGSDAGQEFELLVNHPLRWSGAVVYQAAYRWSVVVRLAAGDGMETSLLLPQGESLAWPGTSLQLVLTAFEQNAGHDPRAALLLHDGVQPIGAWQLVPGERRQVAGLWLEFEDWGPQTGLLVRRDAGARIVALGAILVAAGVGARTVGVLPKRSAGRRDDGGTA